MQPPLLSALSDTEMALRGAMVFSVLCGVGCRGGAAVGFLY